MDEALLEQREQKRAYNRAAKQRSRAKKRILEHISEKEVFWQRNRNALPSQELTAMLELHEQCLDKLFWMKTVHEQNPTDEDYVPLEEEGVSDLLEFIKQHPCPHLGYAVSNDNIPSNWSSAKFWQDRSLTIKLCDEGPATHNYIKFGLLGGLPDWHVISFLVEKGGWPENAARELCGQVFKRGNSDCEVWQYEKEKN